MDYSLILNEISNNQALILEYIKELKDNVVIIGGVVAALLIYLVVRKVVGCK